MSPIKDMSDIVRIPRLGKVRFFVLTSKKDGQKYVMTETTLRQVVKAIGEENFDSLFTCKWVVLNEDERKLAEEIRQRYFA